jgi:hypothetical protein
MHNYGAFVGYFLQLTVIWSHSRLVAGKKNSYDARCKAHKTKKVIRLLAKNEITASNQEHNTTTNITGTYIKLYIQYTQCWRFKEARCVLHNEQSLVVAEASSLNVIFKQRTKLDRWERISRVGTTAPKTSSDYLPFMLDRLLVWLFALTRGHFLTINYSSQSPQRVKRKNNLGSRTSAHLVRSFFLRTYFSVCGNILSHWYRL